MAYNFSLFRMFLETENLNLELDQRHQKFKDAIDRSLNAVGNFINLDVDQLVNLSEVSEFVAGQISILPQYVQRFSASLRARLPEILERIQAFVDNVKHAIDDIIQKQPITKTLEKISHHWEKLVERYGGGMFRNGLIMLYFRHSRFFFPLYIITKSFRDGLTLDGTPGSIYERIRARLWEYAEGNGPLAKTLKEILTAIKTVKEKLQQVSEFFYSTILRRWSGNVHVTHYLAY